MDINLMNILIQYIEDITWPRGERVKYFQHEKKNFVPPSDHIVFYLLYKYQTISLLQCFCCERRDLLCSHSNGDLFTARVCYFHV